MNIILIGMRGSGKTSVGKMIASCLNYQLLDMDEEIIEKTGKKIPEIIKQYGWDRFRDLEEEIAKELAKEKQKVIATGGGVILRKQNIINLKRKGVIIWLTAKIDTLVKRIGHDPNRPLLTKKASSFKEDLKLTFKKRARLYQNSADYVIDTENKSIEEVTGVIINLFKNYD
jgi:shikimate kinase